MYYVQEKQERNETRGKDCSKRNPTLTFWREKNFVWTDRDEVTTYVRSLITSQPMNLNLSLAEYYSAGSVRYVLLCSVPIDKEI